MVVSSTSMNVGMTTAAAMTQGLIAVRLTAAGARATLLMVRAPWRARDRCRSALGLRGDFRRRGQRWLQHVTGVRARGRLLVVDVRLDRQAHEQGGILVGVVV